MPKLSEIQTAFNNEDWTATIELGQEALEEHHSNEDMTTIGILLAQALCNAATPDLAAAIDYYERSLKLADGNSSAEFKILSGLGWTYHEKSDGGRSNNLRASITNLEKALTYEESAGFRGEIQAILGSSFCELSSLDESNKIALLKKAVSNLTDAIAAYERETDATEEIEEALRDLEWARRELLA